MTRKTYYKYKIQYDPWVGSWMTGRYWWKVDVFFDKQSMKEDRYGVKIGSGWRYSAKSAKKAVEKNIKQHKAHDAVRAQVKTVEEGVC